MKKRIVFHYLLFLIIIYGAFASMAQNNYGLSIISVSCFLFALSLIIEVVQNYKISDLIKLIELFSLSILFVLFGLRAAYIHFLYVEWLLMLTCALLIIIYALYSLEKTKKVGSDNKRGRNLILAYYISLIGFTLSIVISMIAPSLAEPLGALATAFLGFVFLGLYLGKTLIIDGVEVKTSDYLRKQAGHSILLMTSYLLISLYSGLNLIGVLPGLYTDKLPQAYIKLINDAETGKESAVDGVYKHEIYKEAYDKFLKEQNIEE